MKLSDLLLMSMSNLWKRKLRTVLTVLGVVIGITSIVVMMALGNGLKESMLESISSYSSITQITVNAGRSWNANGEQTEEKLLNDELVKEFEALEHVDAVYPRLSASVIAKKGKYIHSYMELYGMTQEGLASLNIPVAQGTMPQEGEELALFYGNNVIVDFYVEKTGVHSYYETGEIPNIDLMNEPMVIIFDTDAYWNSQNGNSETRVQPPKKYFIPACGIMEGNVGEWTSNSSGTVYCDMEALKTQLKRVFKKKPIPGQPLRKNGKPYNELFYSQIIIQVDAMENVQAITQMLQEQGYNAYSDAEWIQSETEQMNTIQLVLGAIGAVSLLVAAIGITNTMMMSIYERTKEIGVMKVLGCDIRNIQVLFLLEAGFIGFIGGIIGVAFSYGLSAGINSLFAASMGMGSGICRIPGWLPLLAIGFAIIIGMVAGFLPSLRAMRLSPLAAIRNE